MGKQVGSCKSQTTCKQARESVNTKQWGGVGEMLQQVCSVCREIFAPYHESADSLKGFCCEVTRVHADWGRCGAEPQECMQIWVPCGASRKLHILDNLQVGQKVGKYYPVKGDAAASACRLGTF